VLFPLDKYHHVVLRQAAENPELSKDVGKTLFKELNTSVLQVVRTYGGTAVASASGCGALLTAFYYFSTLGHNVASLRGDIASLRSDIASLRSDIASQRSDSNTRFDAYNARWDAMLHSMIDLKCSHRS
jgi:hypothetical protein